MELLDKEENQIVFTADIDESLANAIRRYLNQIPIPAIEDVEIFKNDSPLYDETIAHRLGLIPLKAEETINEKTPINLKLSSKKEGMVYSGELTGNIEVVYKEIPITHLIKGQELEIQATAKLGKGSEHSKFSPGLMFYREISEIIMDKSLKEKVSKICPQNEIKDKGDKIIILDNKKKEIRDVCEGIADKSGKKAEIKSLGKLIITLESFGQMDVKEMFKKSIETLKKDLEEVSKKISK